MIKLQEFARLQGVTDRQVQRLLKKYAAELEGLYERKGVNGTWLSDEACEILRSKMKQAPLVVSDQNEEAEKWRKKYEDTLEKFNGYMEHATPLLEAAAQQTLLLEQSNNKIKTLEAQNDDLRADNVLKDKTLEDERKNAQKLSDELTAIKGKWWYKLFAGKNKE